PIARALVEQRRILALDGDAQASVLTALDALTLAPEQANMESNVYLGLRAIFWQLTRAKSDDQLRDVVARMWDMAVHLEDGSVSDAEQALRAAEEALRQALERGASDEEIKRLTDQLRAALDKFLQALAEQMRKKGFGQGQQGQGEMDQLGRAGDAMGDAEGQLGEGNADGAVDSQGRALEALRRGAQNFAQSMQQQGMLGPGPNGQPGRRGPPRAQQDTDPLGRPLRGRDYC